MAIIIKDGSSGNLAGVDSNTNVKVNLPTTQTQAGFATIVTQQDAGTYTGARNIVTPETSFNNRLKVGLCTPLFNEYFQGANLNSAQWNSNVTTMTVTTAGGFLNLNAGASTASGAVARVQSSRQVPFQSIGVLSIEMLIQLAFTPVANNITEWGVGYATGTTIATDGIYFRLNSAGNLECVVNNNGSETISTVLSSTFSWLANTTYHCKLVVSDDIVAFWVNGQFLTTIARGSAAGLPSASSQLPLLFRTYNTASTSNAQQLKIASAEAYFGDTNTSKPWPHIMAGAGLMAYQGQTGGTMGTTANYANSANPTATLPTNTTAALGSGLGGQFWSLFTLAVNTDGIISSYQNPVGTAALPAKTLYITGVTITSYVQTVLVGGPAILQWCLAFGHTSVSLATTESATSKAPRRIGLGNQVVTAAQAVSTLIPNDIVRQFASPIVINPGEFIQAVYKVIGTVGTGGTIAHNITFDGYWE